MSLLWRPRTGLLRVDVHVPHLDGGLEDVQRAVLVAHGSGRVADQLPIGADPVGRGLRVANGLAAKADLLTLHHKHFGGVPGDHGGLAHKLLLLVKVRKNNSAVESLRYVNVNALLHPKKRF